ncbi:VWA domain-containing protein [Dactylosporangium roseum]|uniref:VWA domain-containing protein n=1 Tax=Dactylosporangium roseum TaxID=47989 RepID=A0ABY5YX86_9ACTN|nr:VWA domain-containing protein [Dactylosporangium roseum]UWZ34142.1 VWA domain-containing protein [Dactylosporangium roseum]
MIRPARLPSFLEEVVVQLRHHRVRIGVDDLRDLRACLRNGHGLRSEGALRDLCVALWAKSAAEASIVRTVFARVATVPRWTLPADTPPATGDTAPVHDATPADRAAASGVPATATAQADGAAPTPAPMVVVPPERPASESMEVRLTRALPLTPVPIADGDDSLLLVAEHPTTERQIAQAWRRLARRRREGPRVELDIAGTVARYLRYGWESSPELVSVRRNTATLVVLVDRNGSMVPYHDYVDHVVESIARAGGLARLTTAYFHDLPAARVDRSALGGLPSAFRPDLDPIVEDIPPLTDARVYADPRLVRPLSLRTVLHDEPPGTAVVIISDAGAARGGFNLLRQHDTVALGKLLAGPAVPVVWLNPAPERRWALSDAGRISRYVPMFPLTLDGMNDAVDVLRGHPATVERPL